MNNESNDAALLKHSVDIVNSYADTLKDEIVDVASELGIELSALDVTNIAIYTLHGILTATGTVEVTAIKKSVCEMIGKPEKISNYLYTTLAGISATDDAIADETLFDDFDSGDGTECDANACAILQHKTDAKTPCGSKEFCTGL